MKRQRVNSRPRERAVIEEAQRILAVPWGQEAVSEAEQRAAARRLGNSRYLPDLQRRLPLPAAA
jgi:hypothetical protein